MIYEYIGMYIGVYMIYRRPIPSPVPAHGTHSESSSSNQRTPQHYLPYAVIAIL